MNLYNDIDERACAWTQALIDEGCIAAGKVLCKSITEITANELTGYTQIHWFNGISGWARALDLAGWSRNRPVWCASLPCQSFSCAGEGKGFDDERGQLWYPFFNLVRECRPECICGEQVEAAIKHGWIDRVFTDLESEGYACWAVVLPAASCGAPHIRSRIFWFAKRVAESKSKQFDGQMCAWGRWSGDPDHLSGGGLANANGRNASDGRIQRSGEQRLGQENGGPGPIRMGEPILPRLEGHAGNGDNRSESRRERADEARPVAEAGESCGVDNSAGARFKPAGSGTEGETRDNSRLCGPESGCANERLAKSEHSVRRTECQPGQNGCDRQDAGRSEAHSEPRTCGEVHGWGTSSGLSDTERARSSAVLSEQAGNSPASDEGFWSDSIWWLCRDGKRRRVPAKLAVQPLVDGFSEGLAHSGLEVDSELFPLAPSEKGRVALLRGAGNAIVPPLAAEFIRSAMEALDELANEV